jgi:hypothetical protein
MNVTVDLQRFCWLVENGFETSLKQWSDSTVFSIEPHAIAGLIIDVRENRVKIGDKRQIEHRSFETPKLKPNPSTKIQSYWKPKNSL